MIPLKDVNPTRRPAVLTIALIVVCVLVFAYQQTKADDLSLDSRQGFICEYGLIADNVVHGPGDEPVDGCDRLNQEQPRFLALLTSLFLHADWLHLGFNMLFLWVFGNNIEQRLGRIRYIPFFLVCGILATLAQVAVDPGSQVPLIGASGAISGILGAYLVLYPRVPVWTVVLPLFFLPFKLPAWIWLLIYLALQLLYLGDDATAGGGGVAYMAHIGGFIAGAALIRPFLVGRSPDPPASPASPVVGRPW
ncbi:MAG TPA: rhomboid family intramembrane serine protease [Miltoncostaeaceae bacterium]|nr:rhomboid family intramembrane serine protease [Miltoncostaeaceae bacterium]